MYFLLAVVVVIVVVFLAKDKILQDDGWRVISFGPPWYGTGSPVGLKFNNKYDHVVNGIYPYPHNVGNQDSFFYNNPFYTLYLTHGIGCVSPISKLLVVVVRNLVNLHQTISQLVTSRDFRKRPTATNVIVDNALPTTNHE